MLLINRLKNQENLSDTEKQIANYVLENPEETTKMTIHELSLKTFASAATITRFCQKMHTDGFPEFKIELAREMSHFYLDSKRVEDNLPFTENESPQMIVKNILNLNIQSLTDTYEHLDLEQLVRVSHMINQSQHIYLYGTGQSLILAQDFQYKMYRIHRNCHLETQVGFQHIKAFTQNKDDGVVMMISYYGKGINNLQIIKELYKRDIPVILITGPNFNPLCQYAKEVIHVPAQEELMKKMASFSSRSAIQLVLDLIYALVFSLDYQKNKAIVEGKF